MGEGEVRAGVGCRDKGGWREAARGGGGRREEKEEERQGSQRRFNDIEEEQSRRTAGRSQASSEGTLEAPNADTATLLIEGRVDGRVGEGDTRGTVATVSRFVDVAEIARKAGGGRRCGGRTGESAKFNERKRWKGVRSSLRGRRVVTRDVDAAAE